ncbi:MAG TPA: hypothetical protein VGH81_10635 [Rudaea sp.]|jgi:hypothetical protein
MEWIDVVDSAIKIGLGAAITGVATSLAAKRSHDREIDKARLTRKLDTIEQIAVNANKSFDCWRIVLMAMGPIYSIGNPTDPPTAMPEKWLQLENVDRQYLDNRTLISEVAAKLRLLRLKQARKTFNVVFNRYSVFRDQAIGRRQLPNKAEFEKLQDDLMKGSGVFFEELSESYIGAAGHAPS